MSEALLDHAALLLPFALTLGVGIVMGAVAVVAAIFWGDIEIRHPVGHSSSGLGLWLAGLTGVIAPNLVADGKSPWRTRGVRLTLRRIYQNASL